MPTNDINSKNLFLKIDIEGSEYRILGDIIKAENNIEGMVIEFHDCDLHESRILEFLENTSLTLVHIHPNNFGGKDKNGNPIVFELTFSKNPKVLENTPPTFPHKLDSPNGVDLPDITIDFT